MMIAATAAAVSPISTLRFVSDCGVLGAGRLALVLGVVEGLGVDGGLTAGRSSGASTNATGFVE
jgi:hypothetical protein